ncbi:hypothetical protein ADUPG1_004849, partial [Aduncisulcus paluster]
EQRKQLDPWKVGDFAWVIPLPKQKRKESTKYLGPVRVIRVVSPSVVEIQHLIRENCEKYPVSRLKKVVGDMTEEQALELAARDEEEYVVEGILEFKVDEEGDPAFKVKWVGWPLEDATWEYPSTLKDLEAFEIYLEANPDARPLVQKFLKERK